MSWRPKSEFRLQAQQARESARKAATAEDLAFWNRVADKLGKLATREENALRQLTDDSAMQG
jgi:hypothetical protein